MESEKPRSAALSTLNDARMRRLSHTNSLRTASYPGEITYLDVFSCSKYDLPPGQNGDRRPAGLPLRRRVRRCI
jgi:hypothetical protein